MVKLLDCTLRDGGYYNNWDFSLDLIDDYIHAMETLSMDFVEIGFRSLKADAYKGALAYSTDGFLNALDIPASLKLAVMINAKEVIDYPDGIEAALDRMFVPAETSPLSLVRIACHFHQIPQTIEAAQWLKENGYLVSVNVMQIADRTREEIVSAGQMLSACDLDVLYFADSMGSLNPEQISDIIEALRTHWKKDLGFHAHDNLGLGIINSLEAVANGANWVDGTVTGMGRGPGNSKTEYLIIEFEEHRKVPINAIRLYSLINRYFKPMQAECGWGTNPFYYLAGKHGIHPTYIQKMIDDTRYDDADILAVIHHLKKVGGKSFDIDTMEAGRHFYKTTPGGSWKPAETIKDRDVLILGSGPGVKTYQKAIEQFIQRYKPFVIALNTQTAIDAECIDIRAACHPIRLLADCEEHLALQHPLVTPASQLPDSITEQLQEKTVYDFGIQIQPDRFEFHETCSIIPNSLVVAYALAIATSGAACRIFLAGFDGYGADDPRTVEMDMLFKNYASAENALPVSAITPTRYKIPSTSIFAL